MILLAEIHQKGATKMNQARKLILTSILLLIIDRIEFAYYLADDIERMFNNGESIYVPFLYGHKPMALAWWIQLESFYMQAFLFTWIAYLWLPIKKSMIWVIVAFGLCMIEFPLTYGEPIAKIPLPFEFYIPVSVSTLRLGSVCYFMYEVVKKAME